MEVLHETEIFKQMTDSLDVRISFIFLLEAIFGSRTEQVLMLEIDSKRPTFTDDSRTISTNYLAGQNNDLLEMAFISKIK